MAELARVLKKGGRLTVMHASCREELNEFHRNLGGVVGNDMLPDDQEMQAIAEAAQLTGISIVETPKSYLFTARK